MKFKKHPSLTHIITCIICFSFIFIFSCTDEKNISCDGGSLDEIIKNEKLGQSDYQMLDQNVAPGIVYYSYTTFDEVRFSIGKTLSNICPFQPILVEFKTKAISLDTSQKVSIIGRAEWHSFSSISASTVFNTIDPLIEEHTYEGHYDVDVTNIFGNEPASIDLLMSVQFRRLNSFEEDKAFFLDHFKSLQIEATGQLFQ